MRAQSSPGLLVIVSTVCMLAFLYLFVSRNAPGLTNLPLVAAVAGIYALAYLAVVGRMMVQKQPAAGGRRVSGIVVVASSLLLAYVFLESTLLDYYQPLSLYDDAIAALALWWGLLIIAAVLALLVARQGLPSLARVFVLALAAWPLAASLWWINSPEAGSEVASNEPVFIGGQDAYDTYRIPGLVLIPAGSRLASGDTLSTDRLLAFAEARRDGALDTGVIDLVLKTSDDGGNSWSRQAVICRHQLGARRGKCGNPTPLFDHESGKLFLAYNLSGLEEDGRWHSSHIMSSEDGGLNWGDTRTVAADNLVFGPGKGMQKVHPPQPGRLLFPGHAGGKIFLIHSDDHGASWQKSIAISGGDETDVAEHADGNLYLATRHIAPIARAPEPNGRLFSISQKGVENWSELAIDKQLPTPVCQASVISTATGDLLFSNPAHHRSRVRMTLRRSRDGGASWEPGLLVYPGPSGYSVLAQGSDESIYLLYENGNMAYSERISLARIAPESAMPN